MKKFLLAMLLGNLMHLGMREAGHFLTVARHDRIKECVKKAEKESFECSEEAAWLEQVLLFELNLSEKAADE